MSDTRQVDVVNFVESYLDQSTWMVKENSNSNYSFAGLQGYLASDIIKEYALQTMYAGEIGQSHEDGFLHIHDLSHAIVPYCSGYGTKLIMEEGFNSGPAFIYSDPPKHLDSLLGQINNFIFTMSGEWAGAQAINSLDTYCAAFIRKDNMTYDEVYREVRQLVYNLNVKTRLAMQSPFTNFSIDLTVPDDIKEDYVEIAGVTYDFKYKDLQSEMNLFNEVLIDCMMEGDSMNKIFTFPILTYGITDDFEWDSPLAEKIFTFADECNTPYFSNFINSDQSPEDVRSMCPMDPSTLIKVMIDDEVSNKSLGDLMNSKFKSYFNGQWRDSRVIRATEQPTVVVIDDRGCKLELGEHHQQTILRGRRNKVVSAKEIVVGDYLIYNDGGTYNFSKVENIKHGSDDRDDLLCVEVMI